MRKDQNGCRKMMFEGGVGCLVLLASLPALITLGFRADPDPVKEAVPASVESPRAPSRGARPVAELERELEASLAEED